MSLTSKTSAATPDVLYDTVVHYDVDLVEAPRRQPDD